MVTGFPFYHRQQDTYMLQIKINHTVCNSIAKTGLDRREQGSIDQAEVVRQAQLCFADYEC